MIADDTYSRLVRKFDRAIRNGRGCQLSHEEIVAILRSPAWMLIAEKEREELLRYVEDKGVTVESHSA